MTHARGHVRRDDKDHLIALSHAHHGDRLRAMRAVPTPAKWDSRALNLIGAVKNQEQCGSCWDFSGTGCVEVAYNKAGVSGGASVFVLSEEYTLSCYRNGQCSGDDNTTVLDWAKAHGLPLTSDYGPYKAAPGTCLYKRGMKLHKIDEWGFANADGGGGVTPTQDIKTAIMTYGAVGCAVAADDAFEAYTGGVFDTTTSSEIDHDIMLVGWDDTVGQRGAWILRNSWTSSWGESGYMRIGYGVNCVGTESVWAVKHP